MPCSVFYYLSVTMLVDGWPVSVAEYHFLATILSATHALCGHPQISIVSNFRCIPECENRRLLSTGDALMKALG